MDRFTLKQNSTELAAGRTIADQPLVSEFAGDPDMADLVRMFVDELPQRIEALQDALRNQDWNELASLSHQLKGAAGGYGFTPITDGARAVEQQTRKGDDCGAVTKQVEELIRLCRRATAG